MRNIPHLHHLWIHKESIADARNNTHPSSSKESKTLGKEIQGILVIIVFVMKKKITINPNQRSPGNPRPPTIFTFPCRILMLLIHSPIYSLIQPTLTTWQIILWVLERSCRMRQHLWLCGAYVTLRIIKKYIINE